LRRGQDAGRKIKQGRPYIICNGGNKHIDIPLLVSYQAVKITIRRETNENCCQFYCRLGGKFDFFYCA